MENQASADLSASAPFVRSVILAYCLAYAPHVPYLPLPVTLWCAGWWAWTWRATTKGRHPPSKKARNVLTLLSLGLVAASQFASGNGFGVRSGVAILATLLGLKPLEVRTRDSALSSLCLSLFLVVFSVLQSDSLLTGVYTCAALLGILALLIRINAPGALLRPQLFLAGRLLLQGLPLAVVLFFVCPRLPFGLFGMAGAGSTTGLSDRLELGDLGLLAANQDVAFRAQFPDFTPNPEQLYWRGLVLWDFDGRTWSRPKNVPAPPGTLIGRSPVAYEIHLEPNPRRWLFSLDMPMNSVGGARFFLDRTMVSLFHLRGGRHLRLQSFLQYNTGRLHPWALVHGLGLPARSDPRTRSLGKRWAKEEKTPLAVLQRALRFFQNQNFTYTLNPPLPPDTNTIDAFLFEARTGYCSHFASALTFLLRAAGIPSRLVLGYLGAEANPIGGYFIVRQAYAHAWTELWLPQKGWTRADPTAAVAPGRIELGPYLSQSGGSATTFSADTLGGLRTVLHGWDAAGFFWERFVLSYGYHRQRRVLSSLGISTYGVRGILQAGALALAALVLGFAATYGLWRLRSGLRVPADPAQRAYRQFCAKLAKSGMVKAPDQGPRDFARRLIQLRPERTHEIRAIIDGYIALRYGPPLSSQRTKKITRQLRAAIRRFSW